MRNTPSKYSVFLCACVCEFVCVSVNVCVYSIHMDRISSRTRKKNISKPKYYSNFAKITQHNPIRFKNNSVVGEGNRKRGCLSGKIREFSV